MISDKSLLLFSLCKKSCLTQLIHNVAVLFLGISRLIKKEPKLFKIRCVIFSANRIKLIVILNVLLLNALLSVLIIVIDFFLDKKYNIMLHNSTNEGSIISIKPYLLYCIAKNITIKSFCQLKSHKFKINNKFLFK
jgi:hypothetical protein